MLQRSLSVWLASSCLLAGLPVASLAQSNPGFILIGPGGVRDRALNYHLDFEGKAGGFDRYRFNIRTSDLATAELQNLAVSEIQISYPNTFSGEFDPRRIELRVDRQSLRLRSATWVPQEQRIEIIPEQPVPAGKSMQVVLSNVRNPNYGGMFYFNCRIITPGATPLLRYVGTWVLSID